MGSPPPTRNSFSTVPFAGSPGATTRVVKVESGPRIASAAAPVMSFCVEAPRNGVSALRDATVVSFCTGGIRCEKAALWLRENGLPEVLQLDGGILGYFEQVGGLGYQGHCFVFDERVALAPDLSPLVDGHPIDQIT